MSKCGSGSGSTRDSLRDWEYKKSPLLQLLGFQRVIDLGRKARRLFEEGRLEYLYVYLHPHPLVLQFCFGCSFYSVVAAQHTSRKVYSRGT